MRWDYSYIVGDRMGKDVVKIYGDGEIWIDGHKKGKIYPDGEIYVDRNRVGKIYEDGDIWIDGQQVGRVFANGDVWIGSKKVATGVYLLDLLGDSDPTPPRKTEADFSHDTRFENAADRFKRSGNRSSDSSFSSVFTFVAVLLIVAFIYGAFRLWLTELPSLLFGNMQVMGTAAMLSTYLSMFVVAYIHCSMATKSKELMFLKALLMQAAAFFANIIVFTILDLIALAISYGFSIGDALGEIGGALGGSLIGMIVIAVFVGLAPTIVSSLISFLCIKKGKTISLPKGIKKLKFTAPKAKRTVRKKSRKLDWDGEQIAKALVSICFVGIFTFFLSTLPMSLFMGFDELSIDMKRMILPVLAVLAGILLRRKLWIENYESFLLGWIVQSAALIVACFANWGFDHGVSSIFAMADIALSSCGMCLVLGLFITFFTLPFVKE